MNALASRFGQVFFMVPHEPEELEAANDTHDRQDPERVALVQAPRIPPVEPKAWLSVPHAAGFLDMTPDALRRALERHIVLGRDGVHEAHLDGIRGRKLAGRWKVQLGEEWASYGQHGGATSGRRRGTPRSGPKPAAKAERSPS
jgi:hypothetical protein